MSKHNNDKEKLNERFLNVTMKIRGRKIPLDLNIRSIKIEING